MKKSFVLIVFLVSLLSACHTNINDLTFVGEGENWSAEVTVHQTNGEETYRFQLNNKGNNLEEIDTFRYFVESKDNRVINYSVNNATLNQEGVHYHKSLSSNSPSTSVEDELVIKVEWNDASESFDLRSK
ncbi:hypothetical protein FITA111629_09940 [Filibacter tadaridae]|uniref:Intracellular proteinase inhibitor n=1 Tax=Filibacter tadaridae TaxID=2483811 RepID=A0A3P5XSX7_9BACL|nr:hypothetical protein [Filibacter tadaridae]VDC32104.1 hypothetical protein FILTAD_02589 [Filibacter tadaridae]